MPTLIYLKKIRAKVKTSNSDECLLSSFANKGSSFCIKDNSTIPHDTRTRNQTKVLEQKVIIMFYFILPSDGNQNKRKSYKTYRRGHR